MPTRQGGKAVKTPALGAVGAVSGRRPFRPRRSREPGTRSWRYPSRSSKFACGGLPDVIRSQRSPYGTSLLGAGAVHHIRLRHPAMSARCQVCVKAGMPRRLMSLRMARADRQAHGENRALARLARHRDIAAHHACKLARDRQSEAGAAELLRGGCICLGKFFEESCLLLHCYADTAVGHSKFNPIASVDQPSRFELELTLLCELAVVA